MNKRQNKSVTKTQHRVQKTKRSRRLNKNRSVKGIRGNNKTKVVGKRRNIVQRGGGRIDDLVGRIFELDQMEGEIQNTVIDRIMEDVTVVNTIELTPVKKLDGSVVNDGMTLLYAACRLKNNPSSYLVSKILYKMQDKHTKKSFGGWVKQVTGRERSSTWTAIIPNGPTNSGSYPQHGAVQAARNMLEKYIPFISVDNEDLMNKKLHEIIKILRSLQEYDDNVPKPLGQWNPSLMGLYNALIKTAYQEFNERYRDEYDREIPSVEDLIEQKLPKYKTELIKTFEEVLKKPKRRPYPHAPPPPGKTMSGNGA
jgi:hypothetical protein